jgi:hypothetical protein
MNSYPISPMLATLGQPPTHFADFAVEAKYDGQRGMAVVDRGELTLLSRNGADITRTFPEISAALRAAVDGRRVVLDGEIVALDGTGVPSFSRLQRRWPQNRRPPLPNCCGKFRHASTPSTYSNSTAETSPGGLHRPPRNAQRHSRRLRGQHRSVPLQLDGHRSSPSTRSGSGAEPRGHRVQAPRLPVHARPAITRLD